MGIIIEQQQGTSDKKQENPKFKVLTDIQGLEDHFGDMDFKIAGTRDGITALQMDMKVHGLPVETLREAILAAKVGRAHILESMLATLAQPKTELSPFAPRIEKIKIDPSKIGAVIGKGGEVINKITSETGAEIDIKEDGLITVAGSDAEGISHAIEWIKGLTTVPEVGTIYEGTVVTIKDFGAFVNILPGTDGMVHISQLSDERVEKVEDILTEGQKVKVKLVGIDDKGRLSLSIKEANRE
jgi:polyribonucleotide nucleotidyltransferase